MSDLAALNVSKVDALNLWLAAGHRVDEQAAIVASARQKVEEAEELLRSAQRELDYQIKVKEGRQAQSRAAKWVYDVVKKEEVA